MSSSANELSVGRGAQDNLIIDVIPSFALALEPGKDDAIAEGPRPKGESVLGAGTVRRIITQGTLVAMALSVKLG